MKSTEQCVEVDMVFFMDSFLFFFFFLLKEFLVSLSDFFFENSQIWGENNVCLLNNCKVYSEKNGQKNKL